MPCRRRQSAVAMPPMPPPTMMTFILRAPPALGASLGTPLRGPSDASCAARRVSGPAGGPPNAHQGAERRGGSKPVPRPQRPLLQLAQGFGHHPGAEAEAPTQPGAALADAPEP